MNLQSPYVNQPAKMDEKKNVDLEKNAAADEKAQMEEDMLAAAVEDIRLDPKEKKLLLKLDAAFVPVIMFTYLSCFLDRSSIGLFSIPSIPYIYIYIYYIEKKCGTRD